MGKRIGAFGGSTFKIPKSFEKRRENGIFLAKLVFEQIEFGFQYT